MRLLRLACLGLLVCQIALSGCLQSEPGSADAQALQREGGSVDCVVGNATLRLAPHVWHVCGPDGPELTALQARLDELEREVSNATEAFLAATADLENATMEELLGWWRTAANASIEQHRTAAVHAVQELPRNVTVRNGSWVQISDQINRSTELPVGAVALAAERRLAGEVDRLMESRRTSVLHATFAGAGGLFLGGSSSALLMMQVRRKASYWSAFSATRDVPDRQRWLGWTGFLSVVVGSAASALTIFLRGWP